MQTSDQTPEIYRLPRANCHTGTPAWPAPGISRKPTCPSMPFLLRCFAWQSGVPGGSPKVGGPGSRPSLLKIPSSLTSSRRSRTPSSRDKRPGLVEPLSATLRKRADCWRQLDDHMKLAFVSGQPQGVFKKRRGSDHESRACKIFDYHHLGHELETLCLDIDSTSSRSIATFSTP
ncbi:uncharacterized protein BCR38DRAFT_407578 [Pseudomassariella vexata]|uniref:Uncharacterized protein n=1 Tax=Pseudomassariella vexata TaxID=1141098 RepID=A0A1Y2E7V0_9PEZI|nr:uncharacterized protein BCR38DRAFT_407578 [Pseudomassariella vexata]ORY67620.1 hypothetical protein BCR38DRAFT_407578 [Pseudomassariella vexata]